jgi:limonene-1,2-epoxide hydrolase
MGDAVELVRQFCAQWEKGDVGALVEYFADDAVYHNIPVDPVSGKDAIRATVDVFVLPATTIELPVMGTFEVRNGKIVAWRDYFDLNQYMRQLPE